MDITNQLKDEYPCSKCGFSVRQSCCGCPEYSEWMKRFLDMKEIKNKIGVDVRKGIYMERSGAHAEGYGSKELDLIDSVNELIRKYFDDAHSDRLIDIGWVDIVNGNLYPYPFTPVLVTVREDNADTPLIYTDVASYTGGSDGFWISNNEPVCGTVIAWMKFPRPAEVR